VVILFEAHESRHDKLSVLRIEAGKSGSRTVYSYPDS
jgi:hypothetical protein